MADVFGLTLVELDAVLAPIWQDDNSLSPGVCLDDPFGFGGSSLDELAVAVEINIKGLTHKDFDSCLSDDTLVHFANGLCVPERGQALLSATAGKLMEWIG